VGAVNEDQDWLARASAGDERAVEALLERHLDGVRGFVARNAGAALRAQESVADLVQSTCRELIERLRDGRFRFHGEAEFKQWLYRAAVMKLMNRGRYWRAGQRDAGKRVHAAEAADRSASSAPAFAVDPGTPSQDAAFHEELERFERALFALTDEQREAIVLFHVERLTHAEIAARKGFSESYSRTLL
jgi:RNA polymerase sigma factor (sigma-70 family)